MLELHRRNRKVNKDEEEKSNRITNSTIIEQSGSSLPFESRQNGMSMYSMVRGYAITYKFESFHEFIFFNQLLGLSHWFVRILFCSVTLRRTSCSYTPGRSLANIGDRGMGNRKFVIISPDATAVMLTWREFRLVNRWWHPDRSCMPVSGGCVLGSGYNRGIHQTLDRQQNELISNNLRCKQEVFSVRQWGD